MLDFSEPHDDLEGVVTRVRDRDFDGPLVRIIFRHPFRRQQQKDVEVIAEGVNVSQFVLCAAEADRITVGDVLQLRCIPQEVVVDARVVFTGIIKRIKRPSSVRRDTPPGQKVGLMICRRPGRLRGQLQVAAANNAAKANKA